MDESVIVKLTLAVFLYVLFLLTGVKSKDTETYGCYSSDVSCGQHRMDCPIGQVVIITEAKYAHLPRTSSCSRGKVSSCNARYTRTCCMPSGRECYGQYIEKDAVDLLRPCLGSRSCSHMTPQVNRKCGLNKLSQSSFALVNYRCVSDKLLIAYDAEENVTSKAVYLFYETPKFEASVGTAKVYGCDVTGSHGSNVKVKALDFGMAQIEGETCSSLEITDGNVKDFSCGNNALRFMKNLYEGVVPFEINIVDVAGNSPDAAWLLVEGSENITVKCGKMRETRKVETQSGKTTDYQLTTTLNPKLVSSLPSSTGETTEQVTTQDSNLATTIPETSPAPDSSTETSKSEDGNADHSTDTSIPTTSSIVNQETSSEHQTSPPVRSQPVETEGLSASVTEEHYDRALAYGGITGGLLLLILLIIIITVICYRRKRCRRYQSRKIEEERNIPDGEERSNEHVDETNQPKSAQTDSQKSSKSDPKRVKGRREKGFGTLPLSLSSSPRVSQVRDSDGYTNGGKPYGNEDSTRDITVEFYDNPGFKTTLQNIKIPD